MSSTVPDASSRVQDTAQAQVNLQAGSLVLLLILLGFTQPETALAREEVLQQKITEGHHDEVVCHKKRTNVNKNAVASWEAQNAKKIVGPPTVTPGARDGCPKKDRVVQGPATTFMLCVGTTCRPSCSASECWCTTSFRARGVQGRSYELAQHFDWNCNHSLGVNPHDFQPVVDADALVPEASDVHHASRSLV